MDNLIVARMQKFTIEDLMRCILGLQEIEIRIYFELLDMKEATVMEIAEKIDRDRTTVQKALRSLMNCGLVEREKVTEKSGFKYIYRPIEFKEVKVKMEELLDEWYLSVKEWLKKY
ncbi:helix-turn-helix domain-containing protein [Methanotorris igneus]|uniref:Transcriptional regulator, TrmB n=1 Tax=Methanotorris igneus (strain DSM 5666 / JCM 11834 / Kol 5) TaxID=880724 RepID=F6BDM3_METIK|nr:helix-turn-helix domain-containing protein [Methanotorris igneus]AEF96584.1 transcriptional regulator, TrmB [Methanotorris igneus Kol 5]